MAIVKMNKFTLLAFESQKPALLEKLQEFSYIEFFDLQSELLNAYEENLGQYEGLENDNCGSNYVECEEKLSKARGVINYLKEFVPKTSMIKSMREGKRELSLKELENEVLNSNFEDIVAKVKSKEEEINSLKNQKGKLQNEIDSLEIIEGFDAPLESLTNLKTPLYFGSVPKQYKEQLIEENDNYYIELVNETDQDVFVLIMCNDENKDELEEKLRSFGFNAFKTELKEKPVEVIQNNMDEIEKLSSTVFFIEEELASYDRELNKAELVYEYYSNILGRKNAIGNFLKTENVSVIKGWVPSENVQEFTDLLNNVLGKDYYLDVQDVTSEEIEAGMVPTKLKNSELNSAFEDITSMYSTPRYNEIDPTPLLTPFYLLFFGMMVADMGYGLVQIIGVGLALKYFKFDESKKKFAKFFFYLGFPIFGFGAIFGTIFGVELGYPHISQIKDINTVLISSVVFGAIQITVGLGIKAYMLIRDGRPKEAFYDVGAWYLALIGTGLVIGFSMMGLPVAAKYIGIVLMAIGMVTIVLTNGREAKSKAAQLGQGAYALYGITSYVGDLVSYTRLMALGLSGGSLAAAFNMMAGMLPTVAMFLFAPFILVIGHMFNYGLSLLGAYVHTCRLQYVEFFGKFYEGGGRAFAPFKTINEYISIKNKKC